MVALLSIILLCLIAFITGIAATILLCIIVGSISFINTNKIFQKSFTQNIAPKGQKSQVIMPDGTMAFLNSGGYPGPVCLQ